ncbi:MAG: hypothetical protein AVDCRST_MAG48-1724, partial [uncultured Friedmanniella sp.]
MTQPLRTTALTRPSARMGAAAVLAGLLALTGCGSSDEDSSSPAASSSQTSSSSAPSSSSDASPSAPAETGTTSATASLVDFGIELSETEMAAGEYEFEVTNDGDASHDFVVERDGEDVAATEVL